MIVPTVKQEPMIDFNPFMEALEKKYGFEYRDMAGKYSAENPHKFDNWCDRKGYGKKDPRGKDRGSSQIWYAEYSADPDVIDLPYLDGWHYFLENDFSELRRGGANYMCFSTYNDIVLFEDAVPDWIRPVYQAIFNEVKDHETFDGECVTFHIDW